MISQPHSNKSFQNSIEFNNNFDNTIKKQVIFTKEIQEETIKFLEQAFDNSNITIGILKSPFATICENQQIKEKIDFNFKQYINHYCGI